MSFKYTFIYFCIIIKCYILICECNSEYLDSPSYVSYRSETKKSWSLHSINAISNETDEYIDTFIISEGRMLIINIYYYDVNGMVTYMLYRRRNLTENYIKVEFHCLDGLCSAKMNPIPNNMSRWWTFWFYNTKYTYDEKNINFHIRPSPKVQISNQTKKSLAVIPYNVPKIYVNTTRLSTHLAKNTITQFDAYGCYVYSGNFSVNLNCRYTAGLSVSNIEWNYAESALRKFNQNEITYFVNISMPEHDGSFCDCTVKYNYYWKNNLYTDDYTIVRIFFIDNGNLRGNDGFENVQVKPISNDDYENCIKYVNCLYDPGIKENKKEYCIMSKEASVNNKPESWKTGVIIAAVILILLILVFLILKYVNYMRNKDHGDYFVDYSPRSVPNQCITAPQASDIPSRSHAAFSSQASLPETNREELLIDNDLYTSVEECARNNNISNSPYAVIVGYVKDGKNIDF